MTNLVVPFRISLGASLTVASMAEANGQEVEQGKKKEKNPIEEIDDLIGSYDDGEDVDRRGEVMETTGKKRKKRKRELVTSRGLKTEAALLQDPLTVFGSDIMTMILNHLDARSVALSLLTSRRWHAVASSDRLWNSKDGLPLISTKGENSSELCETSTEIDGGRAQSLQSYLKTGVLCEELWLGKAHMPRSSQVRGLSKLAAYSLSVMDGKRTRIMKEDLCDHAWEFHFNEAAPEYWRNLDPYWKGTGPPMRRYFHPDGTLSADPGDEVWGGHESCFSIVTSFVDGGRIREHYVRINRWPRLSVSRKHDWSWEISNYLYCYSSIPDTDKEGGTGPLFPFC